MKFGMGVGLNNPRNTNAEYALEFNGTNEYLYKSLPANLLSNGSFETLNDFDGWSTSGTVTFDNTEVGRTGNYCLKIAATTSLHGIYRNLVVGKKYKLTIRYKGTTALRLGYTGSSTGYGLIDATSQWNTVVKTFTAQTPAFRVLSYDAGTIWIDDISITEDWKLDLNESWERIKHSINRDFEQVLITLYTSNFSAGEDGWNADGGSVAGNIDNIGGENDCLRFTANSSVVTSIFAARSFYQTIGKKYIIKCKAFVPSSNAVLKKVSVFRNSNWSNGIGASLFRTEINDTWVQFEFESLAFDNYGTRFVGIKSDNSNITDGSATGDVFYLKDIQVIEIPNLVTNGTFDTASNWTTGSSWIISGGLATHITGSTGYIAQTLSSIVNPRKFRTTYTVSNRTTGSINIQLSGGGGGTGTTRSTNGTFIEDIIAGSAVQGALYFNETAEFDGSIDNIHIYELSDHANAGNHSFTYTTIDKYAGTGSLKIIATGIGTSGSNYVSIPSAQIDTLTSGNKYTLEGLAKSDPTSLTYGSELYTAYTASTTHPYESLTINGNSITASNSSGAGSVYFRLDNCVAYEIYKVTFDFNLNSGTAPRILLMQDGNAIAGTNSNIYSPINGNNICYLVASTAQSPTQLIIREPASVNTNFTLSNLSIKKSSYASYFNYLIGSKSGSIGLNPNSWTKFVLNFVATSNEVNQDLKLYLNNSANVYIDNISLTQAYDMAVLGLGNSISGSRTRGWFQNRSSSGPTSKGWDIGFVATTNAMLYNRIADGTTEVSIIANFTENIWNNIGATINRTDKLQIYLNGIKSSESSISSIGKMVSDFNFELGARNSTNTWNGKLGNSQILRFTNISQSNFNPTTYRIGDTITGGGAEVVLWLDPKRDKTSITQVLRDWSGNGNDLTGSNMDLTNLKRKL